MTEGDDTFWGYRIDRDKPIIQYPYLIVSGPHIYTTWEQAFEAAKKQCAQMAFKELDLMEQSYLYFLAKEVHETAKSKGWYDPPPDDGSRIALMHSELSEALECIRDGQTEFEYEEDGKPVGLPSELADVLIRVFDYTAWLNIDISKAVREKMAYNKTRPQRHGGKKM